MTSLPSSDPADVEITKATAPTLAVDDVDWHRGLVDSPHVLLLFWHRQDFLATVSCLVPVLLAVVKVAIKFLGALTLALASAVVAVVLAAFAIDLLAISLLPHASVVVLHVRLRRSACGSADW